MGIITTLERQYKQDCVYWGNPQNDGEGGFTFDEPVELKCRWEETKQVVSDAKGNMIASRAVVFTKQDLDEEGYLFLGTLEDVYDLVGESSEGGCDDPASVEGAYIIKRFQKTPALGSTTEFLRSSFLTPSLSFGGF